jgi:hypothetical protein
VRQDRDIMLLNDGLTEHRVKEEDVASGDVFWELECV